LYLPSLREQEGRQHGPLLWCPQVEHVTSPVASYGGAPATEALSGLDNVKRLVYISAFALEAGESLTGLFGGGEVPPFWGKDQGRSARIQGFPWKNP
jgi:hypothetical protein